jgi:guanylate kinase
LSEANLYVVAAPSGGGKTSLINALLEKDPNTRLSVSYTTRAPRPGETDGVHYHFVSADGFEERVRGGQFLEHARVFDHHYGTGRAAVERELEQGHDVILDIDWQGARQVRRSFPSCCTIFIVPPSIAELRRRLAARGQDEASVIERRMRDARSEISHWKEFDHVIVNDDFDAALGDLESIIHTGRPARDDTSDRTLEILAELLRNG